MVKILFVSDLKGKFEFLNQKLNSFREKGKLFDIIFCIGFTFSQNLDNINLCQDMKSQIYFLDMSDYSQYLSSSFPHGYKLCNNLNFLGRAGIINIKGLNIAYINGIQNQKFNLDQINDKVRNEDLFLGKFRSQQDINQIELQHQKQYIDIFISHELPLGLTNFVTSSFPQKICQQMFSQQITDLLQKLNPRYHIIASTGCYFQRQPYKNNIETFTRIILLGSVRTDQNSMYAIDIQPIDQMNFQKLKEIPSDATENPFILKQQEKLIIENNQQQYQPSYNNKLLTENQQLFIAGFNLHSKIDEIYEFLCKWGKIENFQMIMNNQEASSRKKTNHKGYGFVKFLNIDNTNQALQDSQKYSLNGRKIIFALASQQVKQKSLNCWFCLSSNDFDSTLLIAIQDDFYFALDKGALTDRHIQIVPIEHINSIINLSLQSQIHIQNLKKQLNQQISKQYNETLIFLEKSQQTQERFQHYFIQGIPIPSNMLEEFLQKFKILIDNNKLKFDFLSQDQLVQFLSKQSKKFFFCLSYFNQEGNEVRYVFIADYNQHEQNLPSNFGRESICSIMGWNDKIDWNKCIMNENIKYERVQQLKKLISAINQVN